MQSAGPRRADGKGPRTSVRCLKVCHSITWLVVGGAQENTILPCALLDETKHAARSEGPGFAAPEPGP